MACAGRFGAVCVAAMLLAVSASIASAQSPANFYAGKTVNLIVGSTPGGYYDIAGRVVARHLGQYIPGNPSVIVQNQPGRRRARQRQQDRQHRRAGRAHHPGDEPRFAAACAGRRPQCRVRSSAAHLARQPVLLQGRCLSCDCQFQPFGQIAGRHAAARQAGASRRNQRWLDQYYFCAHCPRHAQAECRHHQGLSRRRSDLARDGARTRSTARSSTSARSWSAARNFGRTASCVHCSRSAAPNASPD